MPLTNDATISITTNRFDPSNWGPMGGQRNDFGREIGQSVNKELVQNYYIDGLSGMMAKGNIGFIHSPRIDSFDFGRYLQLLPDFATKQNLIPEAMRMAQTGDVFNLGKLAAIGPELE